MKVHMHRRQKEPMAKAASHSGCKRDHTPVRTEESSLSLLSKDRMAKSAAVVQHQHGHVRPPFLTGP